MSVEAPIKPYHLLPMPNEAVMLYSGAAAIGKSMGQVVVSMRFLPQQRLAFEFIANDDESASALRAKGWRNIRQMTLSEGRYRLKVLVTRYDGHKELDGVVQSPVALRLRRSKLRSVVFHLLNFESELVGRALGNERSSWSGRRVLKGAGWQVTLDVRQDITDAARTVNESGGYVFTHVGRLERKDGTLFTSDEASEALWGLQALLSFARGAWTAPLLPVGYASDGSISWMEWSDLRCSEWFRPESWYVPRPEGALEGAAPGLLSLWAQDECVRESLWRAIGLYISANESGGRGPLFLEARIILAHAALELLGWLLIEGGCQSPRRGKGPTAAKQVSALLTAAGLPTTVPDRLPNLGAFAQFRKVSNAASLLVGIRNSLAHPAQVNGFFAPPTAVLVEALQLALWWVELIMLGAFDYRGQYGNRLDRTRWATTVEEVPWIDGPKQEKAAAKKPK